MAGQASGRATSGFGEKLGQLLAEQLQRLAAAAGRRAIDAVGKRVGSVTERLTEFADQSGDPKIKAAAAGAQKLAEGKSPARAAASGGFAGIKEKIKGLFGRGNKPKKLKLTNIEETQDVGVPVRVAYNQWTQFSQFPSFMKKVESVEQQSDEKNSWKAQIFLSHRTWEATIIQQIPDYNILWRSKGAKGHVDGSVTFHELAPNLTRIMLAMEYHPQGLFEHTGNLWRAQGRRARLEFKHYRRHVMTQTIMNQEDVEGWRGEIRDGQVVKDHETALREEEEAEKAKEQKPEEAEEGEEGEEAEEGEEGEEAEEGEEGEEAEEGEEGEEGEEAEEAEEGEEGEEPGAERDEEEQEKPPVRPPRRTERPQRPQRPERPERAERARRAERPARARREPGNGDRRS
ncbi:SRPBCC family protein [Dactylosporangium sp. CA-139114]|uniref:SRPBCC family protein n=1 Tax=Dactylosporangium sp. CA-139114 TaxID=3239931 RepID=UPI003D982C6D